MPTVNISDIRSIGDQTVAINLETPVDFDGYPGQFVLIRATTGEEEEETGYYTISSADVEEYFEITVSYHPDGTLGPWLANREIGDTITVEGPYGDIQYAGETDAIVLAEGPGIGPAIGIGERARSANRDVTIIFQGEDPPHENRLDDLREAGATIELVEDVADAESHLSQEEDKEMFLFGFQTFIENSIDTLENFSIDPDTVHIESFGSK